MSVFNQTFNSTFNTFGLTPTLESFQGKILFDEVIPYANIVETRYPAFAIAHEPFVGLKVLVRDTLAGKGTPAARIDFLDKYFMNRMFGKGIIVRETDYYKLRDGYWIVTMPVPKSQLKLQLDNLGEALIILEKEFGIVYQEIIDINVSGRCQHIDTESAMSQINIPKMYKRYACDSKNSPYKIGNVIHINDEYVLLRTRWTLPRLDMFENIEMVTTFIQPMFRFI